jgi:hypothetical protein
MISTNIHLNCYPATFRRSIIDFAVQVVASGGSNTLQVMKGLWENLRIGVLGNLCQSKKSVPIPIYKDEESLAGIIVYNNKGSTNLTNHFVKISFFLWDDSVIYYYSKK